MIFENKIIKGKGKYIPITIITNEYLERTGTNSKWIEENLGINTEYLTGQNIRLDGGIK